MKFRPVVLMSVVSFFMACPSPSRVDGGTGGGATGGGSGITTGGGTGTGGGSEASGGGAADAGSPVCASCMTTACTTAKTDCDNDPDCVACVTAQDSEACERAAETHARVDAFLQCKGGACRVECIGETADGGSCGDHLEGIAGPNCSACLETKCCDEVNACHGAEVCWDGCFTNHEENKCHGAPDAHALYHSFMACVSSQCQAECNGPTVTPACDAPAVSPSAGSCATPDAGFVCNPITNEGCNTDGGYACDRTQSGAYQCFGPPNEVALCGACNNSSTFCAPGHACVGSKCTRYCCADSDCGTGTCDSATGDGGVGLCITQ